MRTRYSDNRKGEALAVLDAHGGNVEQAARVTGIPVTNLKRWRDGEAVVEEVVLVRTEKREGLRQELWRLAWRALDQTNKGLSECSAKEAAAVMGIAIDKMTALDVADGKEGEIMRQHIQPVIEGIRELMQRFIPAERKADFQAALTKWFDERFAEELSAQDAPRRPVPEDEYEGARYCVYVDDEDAQEIAEQSVAWADCSGRYR